MLKFPLDRSMSLDNVSPAKAPDAFNVIIEIPMNADPVKITRWTNHRRHLCGPVSGTAMHYPPTGYVPRTIPDDGDPVDVLVITRCR